MKTGDVVWLADDWQGEGDDGESLSFDGGERVVLRHRNGDGTWNVDAPTGETLLLEADEFTTTPPEPWMAAVEAMRQAAEVPGLDEAGGAIRSSEVRGPQVTWCFRWLFGLGIWRVVCAVFDPRDMSLDQKVVVDEETIDAAIGALVAKLERGQP